MKLYPDIHKGMHSVLALKLGVTPDIRSRRTERCRKASSNDLGKLKGLTVLIEELYR
jgi:hypothetical protein